MSFSVCNLISSLFFCLFCFWSFRRLRESRDSACESHEMKVIWDSVVIDKGARQIASKLVAFLFFIKSSVTLQDYRQLLPQPKFIGDASTIIDFFFLVSLFILLFSVYFQWNIIKINRISMVEACSKLFWYYSQGTFILSLNFLSYMSHDLALYGKINNTNLCFNNLVSREKVTRNFYHQRKKN